MTEIKSGKTLKQTYQVIEEELEEIVKNENTITTLDSDSYSSCEGDTVRIYTSKKEILPGIEIDVKTFRVFLTSDRNEDSSFLEFREPDTGECLENISKTKEKLKEANDRGIVDPSTSPEETVIDLICSLSIGKLKLTRSLLKKLPIKFQYRILRTIEKISESQGTKLKF